MKAIIPVFILICIQTAYADEIPLVAVASNMMHVMKGIHEQYSRDSNDIEVNFVYGSSGNLARQILQGAPFDLYLSANLIYVDFLRRNNVGVADYKEFARGRIGYFIPVGSRLWTDKNLDEISLSLIKGEYHRIAIANPDFAPYGVAAKQALQSAGLWAIESDKLLLGENIAQTVQFTLTGSVDIGIIPSSYAMIQDVVEKGKFLLIPENWHEPIVEYLVLLKRSGKSGEYFYKYLLSDKVKLILEKNGYTVIR